MRKEFKIKDNEDARDYGIRLYANKIEYGLSNKEIYDLYINEVPNWGKAESSTRGYFQNLIEGINIGYEKALSDREEDGLLQELEEKKLELIKERKKLQTTKVELNRTLTHEARFELFYENIKEEIKTLPLPEFNTISYEVVNGKVEDVQVITDIHYGANFKSEHNEYSREICKERFELLLAETIAYCKKEQLTKLKIFNLADDIQGILRMTDLKINEVPVVQAVVEISRIIANYLNELSAYVNVEYYHTMSSNHSQTRPLGSKASEIATEDMELIIGNYIKDLLVHNDRVNVYLSDKDYTSINICGYESLLLHGHQVKNVGSVVKDYSMLHRKFYQYVFLGHTHAGQTKVVGEGIDNAIEILVTPSFVGSDPYSDSLKVGAKAMSKIYRFEEGKGLVQTRNIILN